MKICRKCEEEKQESEFYKHVDSLDGLDSICKSCRRADSKSRYESNVRQLPWSTEKAIELLSKNGIPTTVGRVVGRPGKDIVAYGYITIEAKSSQGNGWNRYVFGMTRTQKSQHCDYYVLICKDIDRVFVIPEISDLLTFDGTALYINTSDPRLGEYEGAYQQIKDRVIRDIRLSQPIGSVRVLSGNKYYDVSSP